MFRALRRSSSGAPTVFAASGLYTLQIQLELLMMSDVTLETCWDFMNKWNNKFRYQVAFFVLRFEIFMFPFPSPSSQDRIFMLIPCRIGLYTFCSIVFSYGFYLFVKHRVNVVHRMLLLLCYVVLDVYIQMLIATEFVRHREQRLCSSLTSTSTQAS